MKKSMLYLISFVLLFSVAYSANAESTEIPFFGGGLSIKTLDGNYPDTPLLPNSLMAEGIVLSVAYNTPIPTDGLLLVPYKDELLPFYVNDSQEPVYQYPFHFEDSGDYEFILRFDRDMLDETIEPLTFLHFVVVGHLNYFPQHEKDPRPWNDICLATAVCGNESADQFFPGANDISSSSLMCDLYATDDVHTFIRYYHTLHQLSPTLSYEITDCSEDCTVIPIVNGELVMEDGKPVVQVAKTNNRTCSGTVTLPLSLGENHVTFVHLPADGKGRYGCATSNRYTIIVSEEENE